MSTNHNLSQLPHDFPQTITVKVREGEHLRQRQLWAPFAHAGKTFKLIINPTRRNWPVVGEEWVVYPEHSPNGHIVFCHPTHCLRTAAGEHPFVARTAEHVRNHWVVEITPKFRTDWMWKRGPLESVKVHDDQVWITLTDHRSGQLSTWVIPVWYTELWVNRRFPNSPRFSGEFESRGNKYLIHFSDDSARGT